MPEVTLSPPWETLRNELAYTIGESPCIKVGKLIPEEDGNYRIDIEVKKECMLESVRAIVPEVYTFGNVEVKVVVIDYNTGEVVEKESKVYETPKEVADLFCCALAGNCLFKGVVLTEGKIPEDQIPFIGQVVVVINKCIVQFFNDDISDLCNNFNEVAADVFSDVLVKEFPIDIKVSFTTCDSNCITCGDFYCKG